MITNLPVGENLATTTICLLSFQCSAADEILPLCGCLIFLAFNYLAAQQAILDIEYAQPSSSISSSACSVIKYCFVRTSSRRRFDIRGNILARAIALHTNSPGSGAADVPPGSAQGELQSLSRLGVAES